MEVGDGAGVEWRIGDHAKAGESFGSGGSGDFAKFFENGDKAIAPIGKQHWSVNLPLGGARANGRQKIGTLGEVP